MSQVAAHPLRPTLGGFKVVYFRTLAYLIGVTLLALAVGALRSSEAAAWVLVGGLLALVLYHAIYLNRLNHWAVLPRQRELPIGFGSWGMAFDRIGRFSRQDAIERSDMATELERMHAAVDTLPDGLVVLDRFDHVQWSNRAAQQLHGIFGARRPIDHFIRQPEFLDWLHAEGSHSTGLQTTLPSAPGRMFLLKIEQTDPSTRLLVTRDVTEPHRLDEMRRDFVANVSHEIRTPLTVVSGFVETLIDLDLPADEQRSILDTVRRQTSTMERLVEDLLTLASLEHGAAPPEEQAVAIPALLERLAADMRVVSAGQHDIQLQVQDSFSVQGALGEIESAVRNLLSNAVRYTPAGGIITAGARFTSNEALVWVQDTGIGIAAEHLPRLTERFYRVDRGRSRATGGTGLGLAIVKHVAQRHRARLDIQSVPGRGSTFSLNFPRNRARSV
jgi:two-component system phosphate regulon sensor histidine kinase PhoR